MVLIPTTPSVFLVEFDNTDQLLSVVYGKNFAYTAHGITLQEVDRTDHGAAHCVMSSIPRTGNQSLHQTRDNLQEYFVILRKRPIFAIRNSIVDKVEVAFRKC